MQSLFKRNGKPFYRQPMAMVIAGLLSFTLAFLPLLPGFAIAPSAVPNPRQTDDTWVVDMANLLSPTTEATLNQTITQLEATNGTEIAVVTVPDTQPSRSPKAFATKLFNSWGIGKSDVDNGLLFLVSAGERRTEIETGYGIEGVLTDAELGNILRTQVSPEFKRGDFDAGVLAGVQTIAARLETQTFSAAATAAAAVTVAADLATAVVMPVGEALAVALAVEAVPAIAGKRTFTVGSSQLFACRFHHMSRVSTPPIFGRSWQDIKNISLRVLCF